MRKILLVVPLVAGCSEPTTAWWLLGASAGWAQFNHRVSHWEAGADEDGAYAAFVGGTSTTGEAPPLPETCDASACGELPFVDPAALQVTWATTISRNLASGRGSGSLIADADGAVATVRVPLDGEARGDATAWLQGFAVSSRQPLDGGDACYLPDNGWLPRRLALEIGSVTVEGDEAIVEVSAAFEAGTSGEAMRRCMDDVVGRAALAVRADVVVLVSPAKRDHREVTWSMDYPWDGEGEPPEQLPPDPGDRRLALRLLGRATGWTGLEWRFQRDDATAGAYLRTLSFALDPVAGVVDGHATNWSPLTQLSGLQYTFRGKVSSLDLPLSRIDGARADEVEPELNDGQVVVTRLGE
jgi:hypothetical protein